VRLKKKSVLHFCKRLHLKSNWKNYGDTSALTHIGRNTKYKYVIIFIIIIIIYVNVRQNFTCFCHNCWSLCTFMHCYWLGNLMFPAFHWHRIFGQKIENDFDRLVR